MRVLITGAASGIGLGLAQYLAARGHQLWLTDLDGDGAAQATVVLQQAGASAHGLALDVTSQSSIDAVLAAIGPDDGVELLVNNAGLQYVAPLEEFPREQWERLVAVVLTGAAMLTRVVLPSMRRHGFGRVVNIGSIHSLVASPFKSAYVAAKHGLTGLTKALALELTDVDVTINTVCPAYVRTPLVAAQIAAQARAHGMTEEQVIEEVMLKPRPKRAFVSIEEVGTLVEFPAGDAARNLTGQSIAIDGGWTAQ